MGTPGSGRGPAERDAGGAGAGRCDMTMPGTPRDVPASLTVQVVADCYVGHHLALTDHQHGIVPLIGEQVAAHAIAALAFLTALSGRAVDARWRYMVDALAAGATVEQVAAATSMEAPDLQVALVEWNAQQLRHGLIDDARHAEVFGLASGAP